MAILPAGRQGCKRIICLPLSDWFDGRYSTRSLNVPERCGRLPNVRRCRPKSGSDARTRKREV